MQRDYEKWIKELAIVAGFLWERGWAERNAGNISVNITDCYDHKPEDRSHNLFFETNRIYEAISGNVFMVTGTGKRMRQIAENPQKHIRLIRISEDGKGYHLISDVISNSPEFLPTSELPTHLDIHESIVKDRKESKAVLHTHPSELIAITQISEFNDQKRLNRLIWSMHPESVLFLSKGIGLLPYQMPGTYKIGQQTTELFRKHPIVVWEKHGCFAIGKNIYEAFDLIDIVVKTINIFFMCKGAGYEPEGLNQEQLRELIGNYRI